MNKDDFLADSGRTKIAEGSRTVFSNAKRPKQRAQNSGDRCRTPRQGENFSLIIQSDDGRTLVETRAEYMHQAFQRLIDWSIGNTSHNGCAAISGPNGFYTNHQIKASKDFAWIEGG